MLIIFRVISFTISITSVFTSAQNIESAHKASELTTAEPVQHARMSLEPRTVSQAGPPAIDWRGQPAPKIFCTAGSAAEVRVLGVAVLKERTDKWWLVGDSAMVQFVLYDHTCRFLNQTIVQASGFQNKKNSIRWDLDRNSAVSLSMDTMPIYQPAGYCPGGYNCTETPSYWQCGPPGRTSPTTTCSVKQAQLNIKTYAWGPGGNTRQQLSNIWVSASTPNDACECQAGSTSVGIPDDYIYGCRCYINPDMSISMSGENSTGCREQWQLGYCPASPGPDDFIPSLPPPWVNSPGRFPNTTGAGIATPVRTHHTKPGVFTQFTKSALSVKSDMSFTQTVSIRPPRIPIPSLEGLSDLSTGPSSLAKSTAKSAVSTSTKKSSDVSKPPSSKSSVTSKSKSAVSSTVKSTTSSTVKSTTSSTVKSAVSSTVKSSVSSTAKHSSSTQTGPKQPMTL